MSDLITLTGLRARGFHGVFDFEKAQGQEFIVDVELEVDLRAAGASDDLADTVNYAAVAEVAMAVLTGPSLDLIETVASRIADGCLELVGVQRVLVTVHKPGAPIPHAFADVSVTVERAGSPGRALAETGFVVALGSNLGDREGTLAAAIAELARVPGVVVRASSDLVETDPVGGPEQADYLNAVAVGSTTLDPAALLKVCHRIEAEHGRVRTVRWGERTLDLDVIQFGSPGLPDEVVSADPALTLPHPRAHERAFVLLPWLNADPSARVRVADRVMALIDRVAEVDATGVRAGPAWPTPAAATTPKERDV